MGPNVATRDSWKTIEPDEGLVEFDYSDEFSTSDYEIIKKGLVPEAMEDKWFIYYEHPLLFFHRSWTGDLVYRVTLESDEDTVRVSRAELSLKYSDNPVHVKMMQWVFRGVLLQQNIEFPEI